MCMHGNSLLIIFRFHLMSCHKPADNLFLFFASSPSDTVVFFWSRETWHESRRHCSLPSAGLPCGVESLSDDTITCRTAKQDPESNMTVYPGDDATSSPFVSVSLDVTQPSSLVPVCHAGLVCCLLFCSCDYLVNMARSNRAAWPPEGEKCWMHLSILLQEFCRHTAFWCQVYCNEMISLTSFDTRWQVAFFLGAFHNTRGDFLIPAKWKQTQTSEDLKGYFRIVACSISRAALAAGMQLQAPQ